MSDQNDTTNVPSKRCTKCGNEYPENAEFFHRDNRKKSGLRANCRMCSSAYLKRYYETHAEQERDRSKYYRKTHAEQIRVTNKYRYEAHIEQEHNRNKRYHQTHREQEHAYQKRYRKTHREQGRVFQKRHCARKRALAKTFTATDWQNALEFFHGGCAYCGHGPSMFDRYPVLHQDHYIPLTAQGPYTPDNIVPACQSCNFSKNDNDPHEWLIRKFGKRKAKAIEAKIAAFFEWVIEQLHSHYP